MSRAHLRSIYEILGRYPVHPFPARMAPGLALGLLSQYKKKIRVLDPMMGSGTVIALARAQGHRTIGLDIDPLAVLISKAWTRTVDREEVRKKATAILQNAKLSFRELKAGDAYPDNANLETRAFLRYWFDTYTRRQLTALSRAIRKVRNENIRVIMWCAFSRLIITKQAGASLAKDLAHSRPHKSFETAPIKPLTAFMAAVDRVLDNCLCKGVANAGPNPAVSVGDARKLEIASNSVDLILTSPPYLNAIDYMRCSKFSLVWMGYSTADIRDVRAKSVGSEVGQYDLNDRAQRLIKTLRLESKLSTRHKALLSRFIDDMGHALFEAHRVLTPGGKAMYVIGENLIRGTYVRNAKIITALAKECGLELSGTKSRLLPPSRRYLPPPSRRRARAALDVRMRREVVLIFSKPLKKHRV